MLAKNKPQHQLKDNSLFSNQNTSPFINFQTSKILVGEMIISYYNNNHNISTSNHVPYIVRNKSNMY